MNKAKKHVALLLCFVMVMGLMPVLTLATNASTTGLELLKKVSEPDNNVYWLELEAYNTGTVTSGSAVPVDIVLVLDESGSMDYAIGAGGYKDVSYSSNREYWKNSHNLYVKDGDEFCKVSVERTWFGRYTYSYTLASGETISEPVYDSPPDWAFYRATPSTRRDALKAAAKSFVDQVSLNARDNSVDHKIAVVGFANNSRDIIGLSGVSGTSGADSVKTKIDTLKADGGTYINKGLENASTLLATSAEGRKRVVVVFTDGHPGTGDWKDSASVACANDAISKANTIKNSNNTEIYTIGVFNLNETSDDNVKANKLMNYISSNYPNASDLTSPGSGSDLGYYMPVLDISNLESVFGKLADKIVPDIILDGETVVRDVIAEPFELAVDETNKVSVNKLDYSGSSKWLSPGTDITTLVTVDASPNKVDVSGFDFSSNVVYDNGSEFGGSKLIIRIPIKLKEGASIPSSEVPSNEVPTNSNDSGVYPGDSKDPIERFEVPTVTLYTVTFVDWNESVFKSELVKPGVSATAPTVPYRAGYKFSNWDKGFDNIQSDLTVMAKYTKDESDTKTISYTVEYYKDGVKQTADSETISKNIWVGDSKADLEFTPNSSKYSGFTLDASASVIPEKFSDGDVIKIYYKASGGGIIIPVDPAGDGEDLDLNRDDHYAYIVGYPDNTVRPGASITRAEIATVFYRMLTDTSRDKIFSRNNSFTDVSADAWYNNAVSTLTNAEVLTGYPDGTFKPNNPISRAEFAAIASRFYSDIATPATDTFTDISGSWARAHINKSNKIGIVAGYGDGTFRPDNLITRAEAITLMNNVLERTPDKGHFLEGMRTWTDNSDTAVWYYEAIQEATNSHEYERAAVSDKEVWTKLNKDPDWLALEK